MVVCVQAKVFSRLLAPNASQACWLHLPELEHEHDMAGRAAIGAAVLVGVGIGEAVGVGGSGVFVGTGVRVGGTVGAREVAVGIGVGFTTCSVIPLTSFIPPLPVTSTVTV